MDKRYFFSFKTLDRREFLIPTIELFQRTFQLIIERFTNISTCRKFAVSRAQWNNEERERKREREREREGKHLPKILRRWRTAISRPNVSSASTSSRRLKHANEKMKHPSELVRMGVYRKLAIVYFSHRAALLFTTLFPFPPRRCVCTYAQTWPRKSFRFYVVTRAIPAKSYARERERERERTINN